LEAGGGFGRRPLFATGVVGSKIGRAPRAVPALGARFFNKVVTG